MDQTGAGALLLFLCVLRASAHGRGHGGHRLAQLAPKPAIVHGSLASAGEFPHIVQLHLLINGQDSVCGGSIIAPNIVLTAAHCVKEFDSDWASDTSRAFGVTAVAGSLDWEAGAGDGSQRRRVVELVRHQNFSMAEITNDLAVLVLSHAFNFTNLVGSIGLPEPGQLFGGTADIAGWGYRTTFEWNFKPKKLKRASVPLFNDSTCAGFEKEDWNFRYNNKTMVCGGGAKADVCFGDSGGPLSCAVASGGGAAAKKARKVLCGVTSWVVNCGETGVPGFFVRVSNFVPWIQQQVARYNASCAPGEFYCGGNDGKCVSLSAVCDGKTDCGASSGGMDEQDCPGHIAPCPGNRFRCRSGACVNRSWLCDGMNDCVDGDDEEPANCDKTCLPTEFRCGNAVCIPSSGKCDSVQDCMDGSDEEGCFIDAAFDICGRGTFACSNGQCVSERFRCDGAEDCRDASDEVDCANFTCSHVQFQCAVGHCIDLNRKCDNEYDCTDQSDELNATCADKRCDTNREYKCDSGQCLQIQLFCDGEVNCVDGSDENKELCSDYLPRLSVDSVGLQNGTLTLLLNTATEVKCFITPRNGSFLAPQILWLRNGKNVTDPGRLERDENGHSLSLLFRNASYGDAGEYACLVSSHESALLVTVVEPAPVTEFETQATTAESASTTRIARKEKRLLQKLGPIWFWGSLLLGLALVLGGLAYKQRETVRDVWVTWTAPWSRGAQRLINEEEDDVQNDLEGHAEKSLQMERLD